MTETTTLCRRGRVNHRLNTCDHSHGENEGFRSYPSSNHQHRGLETFTDQSADVSEVLRNCQMEGDLRTDDPIREVSREGTSLENSLESNDYLSCSDSDDENISSRTMASGNDSERGSTSFYFSVYDEETDESGPDFSAYDSDNPHSTTFRDSVHAETMLQVVECRGTMEEVSNEIHNTSDYPHGQYNSVHTDTELDDEAYSVCSGDSSSIVESIYESDASEEYNANVYDSMEEDESEDENEAAHSSHEISGDESGYQDMDRTDEANREEETVDENRSINVDDHYHSLLESERVGQGDTTSKDEEDNKLTERLVLEKNSMEEIVPQACETSFRETALQETIKTLEQENEKYRLSLTCKVCFNQEIQIAFVPCGHLATCSQCSHHLYCCPLCRRGILNKIRVFKS